MMFCSKRRLLPALVACFCLCGLYGQNDSARQRTDELVFKIAVYGPSDEIFIWWGHAALIVENIRWGYSRVFDWGIFSYPSDDFLRDFLRNQVRYKCTVEPSDMNMYIEEDRDITVYTLNLDAEQKETILSYAENNVLPENCYYDYHEFRDNCSTRIRDIIDMGTNGQLKKQFDNTPGRFTFREHIRRFTWFRPFPDRYLDFLMGQDLDRPLTVWDEMFLPVEIGRNIVSFRYLDGSGGEKNLVSSVEVLNTTKERPPVLNKSLTVWPHCLVLGLITAALMMSINLLRAKHPRTGRMASGILQAVFGLFFGVTGCILVFGLFFMNNDYIQQNINILFVNPLLLVMVPLGVLEAAQRGRTRPGKWLKMVWTYVFVSGMITVLIKALPVFYQQNQSTQALVLPVAFVSSYVPEYCRKLWSVTGKFLKRQAQTLPGNHGRPT
jgi:hypothetical protein